MIVATPAVKTADRSPFVQAKDLTAEFAEVAEKKRDGRVRVLKVEFAARRRNVGGR